MKVSFKLGLIMALAMCSVGGYAQVPKVIDPKYVGVGKTTDQFVAWAKALDIWNPNDMGYEVFTFYSKPVEGWAVQYRYVFKNDSCQRMIVRPASMESWKEEISRNYEFMERKDVNGKVYHIYAHKQGGHKIAFEESDAGTFENKVLVYPL